MKSLKLIALAGLSSVLLQCETPLEATRSVYLELPETPFVYTTVDNSNGNHLATLGRVLFYDRNVSLNNSISCASCHKQSLAFADNVRFSSGFENRVTSRNSMPIQNLSPGFFLAPVGPFINTTNGEPVVTVVNNEPGREPSSSFQITGSLFWDGRETDLSRMALRPIVNHIEMGVTDLGELSSKLSNIPYYRTLFTNVWGSKEVSPDKIGAALQSFMVAIQSNNTRFDKAMRGEAPLSQLESIGEGLFETKYQCNSCHQVQTPHGYLTMGGGFANIGLDAEYSDSGLMQTTGQPADAGKFKIPSLRNVALTAPYMHDGRFSSLEEVMNHYSEGMANHPNLDFRLRQNGEPKAMNITAFEKQAIIAFLQTLTDTEMIHDQRFSDPFRVK